MTVYKNGSDVTSTTMPAGSHAVSGTNLTLKNLTALIGGELYMIDIVVAVDGVVDEWWQPVQALRETTGKT